MSIHIIYRKELFLTAIIYIAVCLLLGLASMYLLKSKGLSILMLIVMVAPFFLFRILIKKFTRQAFFQLYPDHFVTTISNEMRNEFGRKIFFEEILAYNIQFPNDKFCAIKFSLWGGESFEYSLFQKKQNDEDVEGIELIDAFTSAIKNFNLHKPKADKIIFQPSFYATKIGLACIVILSIFFIFAIILFSLYNEKSLPLTFVFSFILILQLVLKRKKELGYYKQLNESMLS